MGIFKSPKKEKKISDKDKKYFYAAAEENLRNLESIMPKISVSNKNTKSKNPYYQIVSGGLVRPK